MTIEAYHSTKSHWYHDDDECSLAAQLVGEVLLPGCGDKQHCLECMLRAKH